MAGHVSPAGGSPVPPRHLLDESLGDNVRAPLLSTAQDYTRSTSPDLTSFSRTSPATKPKEGAVRSSRFTVKKVDQALLPNGVLPSSPRPTSDRRHSVSRLQIDELHLVDETKSNALSRRRCSLGPISASQFQLPKFQIPAPKKDVNENEKEAPKPTPPGLRRSKSYCKPEPRTVLFDVGGTKFHRSASVPAASSSISLSTMATRTSRTQKEMASRGRKFAARKRDRYVQKDGKYNITYKNIVQKNRRFMTDFFTTMLEMKWRYNFLFFTIVFGSSWIIFAVIWLGLCNYHRYTYFDVSTNGSGYEECVIGVYDFHTAMLFSIETQHTIGYGTRAITTSCTIGMLVLMLQSMGGSVMQCILTGLIFAKLTRPKHRADTLIFSHSAVINQRDGDYYLAFRVGDTRKTTILSVNINAMYMEKRTTIEGEAIPFYHRHLALTTESEDSFYFLATPNLVMHKIDESSPLWELSEENLYLADFEITVILEGVIEASGSTFQKRTSYLPSEILWGSAHAPLITKKCGPGEFRIDYVHFHDTVVIKDMPICSARDAAEGEW